MSNVRKLLARLNPSTQQYGASGGGGGGLTPQDVAAALGKVEPGLGREALCHCWWPGGAALTETRFHELLRDLVAGEQAKQQRAVSIARLDLQIAQEGYELHPKPGESERAIVQRFERGLRAAMAAEWPTDGALHVKLRRAVLREIGSPAQCVRCGGRAWLLEGERRVICGGCGGRGLSPASSRTRAEAMGIPDTTFRRSWEPVFDWLLDRLRTAEDEAARQLRAALMPGEIRTGEGPDLAA